MGSYHVIKMHIAEAITSLHSLGFKLPCHHMILSPEHMVFYMGYHVTKLSPSFPILFL